MAHFFFLVSFSRVWPRLFSILLIVLDDLLLLILRGVAVVNIVGGANTTVALRGRGEDGI